jgi:hypothetical protein
MGGGHSVESIVTNTINAVTSVAMITLQNAQNKSDMTQSVEVTCNVAEFGKVQSECRDKFKRQGVSTQETLQLCNYGLKCSADNIFMTQMIDANITQDQQETFTANIKNNITNKLTATITQEYPAFSIDNSVKSQIDNTVNAITAFFNLNLRDICTEIKQLQSVKLTDASASYVRLEQSSTVISNQLQKNTTVMTAINDLSTTIDVTLTQKDRKIGLGIGLGVLGFIVVLIFLIKLIRWIKNKRANKTVRRTRDKRAEKDDQPLYPDGDFADLLERHRPAAIEQTRQTLLTDPPPAARNPPLSTAQRGPPPAAINTPLPIALRGPPPRARYGNKSPITQEMENNGKFQQQYANLLVND